MGDRDYFQGEFGGGPRRQIFAQHRGTKFLILGLVAIALLQGLVHLIFGFDAYNAMMRVLALSADRVLQGWVWQLITMAGLHEPPVFHLLFNCIYLWVFGRMVENRLTTKQFFGFVTMAAVAGSIAYVIVAVISGSTIPAIGASGACMGLVVLAAAWWPMLEISLFGVFRLQLWVLAAILVVMDLLNQMYGSGGVAYMAHLGGAAYGWVYYKYGRRIEGVFSRIDDMTDKAQRNKERKGRAKETELRKEIDRILDKVNREGMSALSEDEKKFLKNASRKLG